MHRFLFLFGLLLGRVASAAEYAIEVGVFDQREQADALQIGVGRPTVVRRYVDGMGWRFVVVVEGFRSLDEANQAVATARAAGHSADVIGVDPDLTAAPPATAGGLTATSADLPATTKPASPVATPQPDANAVLDASSKAHGGRKGLGAALQSADAVELVVLRTVTSGSGALAFRSRYLRQGDARRVEVQAVSGAGANSVTVVPQVGLPSMTVEGVLTPIDPARARQSVELFSPNSVFGGVLALPAEMANWTSADGVLTVSAGTGDEQTELVLSRTGPAGAALAEGVTRATFGLNDSLARSVTWATPEGDVTWSFETYRKVGDVAVPHSVLIFRDGREVERVVVERLDLAPVVVASELLSPAPGG
jgi:hypothetical protein